MSNILFDNPSNWTDAGGNTPPFASGNGFNPYEWTNTASDTLTFSGLVNAGDVLQITAVWRGIVNTGQAAQFSVGGSVVASVPFTAGDGYGSLEYTFIGGETDIIVSMSGADGLVAKLFWLPSDAATAISESESLSEWTSPEAPTSFSVTPQTFYAGAPQTVSSVTIQTAPSHGTATVNGTSIEYSPNSGFSGADSFEFGTAIPLGDGMVANGHVLVSVTPTSPPPPPPPPVISYNCNCDDAPNNRTLATLRTTLIRRLGFSAQAATPPPGMKELIDSFLVEAQEILYRRYDVLRTERFYSWPIVKDTRMYDLPENAEATGDNPVCTRHLDPRKVTWVGWSQDGMNWRRLVDGIPPELYNNTGNAPLTPSGYPRRYEIRQCIEIWPNPDVSDTYTLRIKGHFGLDPFVADTDKTTIDDRPVFLLALANAKAHYGQPDANNYIAQMEAMLVNLVAGAHNTRRYVPSPRRSSDLIYVEPKPTEPFA